MKTADNVANWIPQASAAEMLEVSEKTLVRWSQSGRIARRFRPAPGRVPEPVYDPADIARLKDEKQKPIAPAVAAHQHVGSLPDPVSLVRSPAPQLQPVTSEMLALHMERQAPPQWMTIEQAARYSGLSKTILRRAIGAGVLSSIRDRARKVKRADLDAVNLHELPPALRALHEVR